MKNFFGEAIDWIGGALDDIGDVIGKGAEVFAGLPGEIRDFADRLADSQRRGAAGAQREATDYQVQRMFGDLGPYVLLGALALAIITFSKK